MTENKGKDNENKRLNSQNVLGLYFLMIYFFEHESLLNLMDTAEATEHTGTQIENIEKPSRSHHELSP